jgi:hypothetical protein
MQYSAILFTTVFAANYGSTVAQPAPAPAPQQPAQQLPNIVIILVDDMGWHNLHAPPVHVNAEIKSPAIAQFAKDGVTLTNYYSYRYCGPSRCVGHRYTVCNLAIMRACAVVSMAELLFTELTQWTPIIPIPCSFPFLSKPIASSLSPHQP